MFRKDLHNNTVEKNALNQQAVSSNTTIHGNIIDLQGFGAIEFLVQMAAWTDGVYTPYIEEGNQSNLSDAASADSVNNIFGTYAQVATNLDAANSVARLGYRVGAFRYVRLSFVSSGVTSGATLGATALLANADYMPTQAA
jgi:hypothetical protein